MSYSKLSELIAALERGTRMHISVVMFNRCGNEKTQLDFGHKIHKFPICDYAKSLPQGLATCVRCRNTVLQRLRTGGRAFGGLCVNGVYEYCRPVLWKGTVAGVVFVGNVLTDSERQLSRLESRVGLDLIGTMERGMTPDDCARTADLTASYLHLLLEKYGLTARGGDDPLWEDVRAYAEEHLTCGFTMEEIAAEFGYNKKYLGRLFKARMGRTLADYCNELRVDRAKALLSEGKYSTAEIAGLVGYNNVTYFDRVFRAAAGCSPTQYRSSAGEGSGLQRI